MSINLCVIDRQPAHSFEAVARQFGMQPGDWIVDFGAYPFAVWLVTAEQTYQNITSTLIKPVDYYQVVDQWLRQFTAKSGLHEILAVKGYGFWWTLGSPHFEPARSAFGHSFARIDILHAIRQKIMPEAVIVFGPKTPFESILRQIFPNSAIEYEGEVYQSDPNNIRGPVGMRLVRLLLSIAYFVYAMIRRPDVCIFTQANSLKITETNGKSTLKDVYFEPIVRMLQDRGWRTTYIEILTSATWRHMWTRRWFFPSDAIEIAGHRRLLKRGFYPRFRLRWQNRWADEREQICFLMKYKNYDMSDLLLPLLQDHFMFIAPSIEIMVNLWRLVFELWRPKLIYVNHYYGFIAVSVIIAAKSLGIVTVEQQHGLIAKHHRSYLPPVTLATKIGFPLCDYLIAWGEQTKRLLVERQVYSPEYVRVCGFPRLDRLVLERPDRSMTLQALNIPFDAKVILYSASPLVDGYLHSILNGIKNGPNDTNVYWVIKMHPSQQTRTLWEETICEIGLQRIQVIEGEFDFYALLATCDLHVSFSSTTFVEAALWGKPNLGLDLPYCPDFTGQLEVGGYQPVSFETLGTVAHTILNNDTTRETLLQKQYAFAQDWCLFNGQSTEYTADALESIMEGQRCQI